MKLRWRWSIVEVEISPSVLSLYLRPWKFWALWVNGRLELGRLDAVFDRLAGRFDRRTKLWKQMNAERKRDEVDPREQSTY